MQGFKIWSGIPSWYKGSGNERCAAHVYITWDIHHESYFPKNKSDMHVMEINASCPRHFPSPIALKDAIWFRPPCQDMKSTQGGTGVENLQSGLIVGETSQHQATGCWLWKLMELGLGVLVLYRVLRWCTKNANDIFMAWWLQSIDSPVSITLCFISLPLQSCWASFSAHHSRQLHLF